MLVNRQENRSLLSLFGKYIAIVYLCMYMVAVIAGAVLMTGATVTSTLAWEHFAAVAQLGSCSGQCCQTSCSRISLSCVFVQELIA